ncbi:putative reverse transcriptase domain-containing protein [Tanacetum coccineum]
MEMVERMEMKMIMEMEVETVMETEEEMGNVIAAEPTRLQDAIRIANNLMDQNLKGYAKSAKNKRRLHHEGPCTVRCGNCKRFYHMARDYTTVVSPNTQRALVGNQLEPWEQDWKQDWENEATARAYAIRRGGANPDSNVITGTFLLNNYYAYMLFDSGADRSFVSYTFSALHDVAPFTLDTNYVIELVDGRISKTNIIHRDCILGLLSHPFDIDLMPVELGSFDVIIGMDWLAKYHAMIVCNEKIVHIPYGDKVLIIRGDDYDSISKSKLNIMSCTKTQKYIQKGCQVYLVQVTSKKTEDKSEEKRLKDVPIVRDFLKVFPEDLPRLPPARQVREEYIPKTAFRTRYGHYESQVMLFGLTNTLAVFMDLINQSRKEHEGHLKLILKLLKKEELYAKCSNFWLSKVQFLGYMIDSEGIHVDPAKIESIKDWAITRPMMKLTQKSVKFDWEEKAEATFQLLKQRLCSALILALPEGSENFVVYCDASHKGLGDVLMQKENVIAYASRQHKVHKKNYTTYNLELGAVVFSLKMWRHYLYSTKCVVFTDHKSLQHILDQKEFNMRQQR